MLVSDLVRVMETIAPPSFAEAWDRVGLQVGVPERPIKGAILLTIDLTERVLKEAVELGAGAIVAYHPPIWTPLPSLGAGTAQERIIRGAIEAGIAVYTPHTALDASQGGITDWLCEGLSAAPGKAREGVIAGDCRALTPHVESSGSQQVKIVTFAPRDSVEHIRGALGTAGAGIIGQYQLCSFESSGTGTFLAGPGTRPAVGSPGRLEHTPEVRLEMVCSRRALALAIETLREFHPYEEAAFDVYELEGKPSRRTGAGRRLTLDQPASIAQLCERLKTHLDRSRVRYALAGDSDRFTTIGVVPGAGESMLGDAASDGCELFVTGEMRHHEIVAALHKGVSVLLAGHTNTERGYLPRLARRLSDSLHGVRVELSQADRDILTTA